MSAGGPFDAVAADAPAPWGPRQLGAMGGLQSPPSDPNSGDMMGRDPLAGRVDRLESDHRALLLAFGAAFVIIIGAFAAGYLALSAKIDAGFAQSGQRIETLNSGISDLKTDVAVLRERSEGQGPRSSAR